MSETLIADITAAIEEFEQTLEATRAGRREHVGASADLRAVMAEVSEQVKVLDGVVRYRFGDNAELMGAWASVHSMLGTWELTGTTVHFTQDADTFVRDVDWIASESHLSGDETFGSVRVRVVLKKVPGIQ